MNKKEIFWILGTTTVILILYILTFGFDGLKGSTTLDINFHDTYFLISNFHFIVLLSVIIFFVVYIFRTLYSKYKNLTANVVLMISIIFLIIVLTETYSFIDNIVKENSGWTVYPPLSASDVKVESRIEENSFVNSSTIVLCLQTLLLLFLSFLGLKTGRYYKMNK